MRIITLEIGYLQENAYLYIDESGAAALVDPGGNPDLILQALADEGLTLSHILLTHGHYDHTGAVKAVKEATGAKVMAHKDEERVLTNPRISMAASGPVPADEYFAGGDIIRVGGLELRAIHTPGHTEGSSCFYDEANGVLFSGDTLFHESVGRSDLPSGNGAALEDSITSKLYTLPDSVRVLTGHHQETTIGHEKSNNPFVRLR